MFPKEEIPFSPKNVAIPDHKKYTMDMLQSVQKFIKRIRWKVYHHNMRCQNGENKTNQQDRNSNTRNEGNNREPTKFDKKYGIKTRKSPPNIPALDNFELDMLNMVKGLKKKKKQKYMNPRLQKINETFKKIKDDDMLKVPADKTMNIYSIDYNKYNELILTELRKI